MPNRSIDAQVSELERASPAMGFEVIIVQFVRPGPNGPIEDEPTGYRSGYGADESRWDRQPGETLEQLKERDKREAPRSAGGVAVLRESYAHEDLARAV